MNRSLNIPRTDELVWNSVVEVMSNSELLKKRAMSEYGDRAKVVADEKKERQNQLKWQKQLKKIKATLAQLLTGQLLDEIDQETFDRVKSELDAKKESLLHKLSRSEVRLTEYVDQENLMNAIDRYFKALELIGTETPETKRDFLELFVDRIDVSYDQASKEHSLEIKFKLPIVDDGISDDSQVVHGWHDYQAILPPNKTTQQLRFSPGCGAGPRPCP